MNYEFFNEFNQDTLHWVSLIHDFAFDENNDDNNEFDKQTFDLTPVDAAMIDITDDRYDFLWWFCDNNCNSDRDSNSDDSCNSEHTEGHNETCKW